MASIGSLSFIVEVATEKSAIFHCANLRRPRISSSTTQGRNFLDPGTKVTQCGILRAGNGEKIVGLSSNCRKRDSLRRTCVSSTKKDVAEEENSDEPEDSLQTTMEKSKKVLALQKELLQQIAERRELVSSIKNGMVKTEDDLVSSNETINSFASLDPTSTGGDDTDERYSNGIISDSYGPTTAVDMHVGGEREQEFGRNLLEKVSSDVKFPRKFEATSSEPFQYEMDLTHEMNGTSAEEDMKPPPLAGDNIMNIILVAAECTPWSKTGGLGDVAGALPKALARRGHRVMVVAPMYGNYAEPQHMGIHRRYKVNGQDVEVNYFHAFLDGVDFVFLESPFFRHIEHDIYGGQREEIVKRMVLLCKAAVEVPWYIPCGGVCYGDGNLVFIANDWHTALLPVYLKAYYRDNGLMSYTRSILVIHNIAHQDPHLWMWHARYHYFSKPTCPDLVIDEIKGRGPLNDFSLVDLPGHYIDMFKLYDPLGGEHFNIFAAGLKTADRVVTVSHGYAWELKTQEGGWGLHGIINENDWKLKGIVNGIDTEEWSPQLDVHLASDGYTNYSLETLKTGKSQCKMALQKELGLPVREDVPLIGFIGRLDHQKGVDLIAQAMPWMVDQDVQLVMLGTGRPDLENLLRQFENQHHDKVRGWVGFSVKIAHRITAGADILLMPSRFEPCGLNQLYAMNYGTIPVVHGVGGLKDTVQPFDPFAESGLGWTFDRAETDRLIHALGNCLFTYRDYKESWEGIQRRGMTQDLSWDNAAQNYEEVLLAAKYHW